MVSEAMASSCSKFSLLNQILELDVLDETSIEKIDWRYVGECKLLSSTMSTNGYWEKFLMLGSARWIVFQN